MFIPVYRRIYIYIYINLRCCLLSNIFFFLHLGKQGLCISVPLVIFNAWWMASTTTIKPKFFWLFFYETKQNVSKTFLFILK